MANGDRALEIAARYDVALSQLEERAQRRVAMALESSYRNLERELLASYQRHGSNLNLLPRQRTLVIMDEVRQQLELIDPRTARQLTQGYEQMLIAATREGYDMAADLATALEAPRLQPFTAVPMEAIAAQARDGILRLSKHVQAFAERASAIVEQGLTQGWGARRVATNIRKELGTTISKAETIARTEVMSAHNSAAKARYKRSGIEYGQWIATPSDRLCPTCAERNTKIYPIDDVLIPAHPRCRCMILPVSEAWGLDSEFTEQYRSDTLAELSAQGIEPDTGLSPFEKAAGFSRAPTAVEFGDE